MIFPKFRGWSSPNDRGENLDEQPIHDGCMAMPNITHVAHVAGPWHIWHHVICSNIRCCCAFLDEQPSKRPSHLCLWVYWLISRHIDMYIYYYWCYYYELLLWIILTIYYYLWLFVIIDYFIYVYIYTHSDIPTINPS